MALKDKLDLGKFFGMSTDNEWEEGQPEVQSETPRVTDGPHAVDNVVSIKDSHPKASRITIFEPHVNSDAQTISGYLMSNQAVIINFSHMENEQAKRVLDFVNGTVYAINGKLHRVESQIFVCTPPSFEIDGKLSDIVSDSLENI